MSQFALYTYRNKLLNDGYILLSVRVIGIASKLSFSPNHFLTNCFPFLVLYAVYCSGLAVLYLGHTK